MTLFDYIADRRQQLQRHINTLIEQELAISKVPYLTDVLQKLYPFMQEGKMIRGILVLLSAEILGETVSSELLNAAASMEFLHSSFLIHDDIMDNDVLRRGKPTIFAQYQQEAEEQHIDHPQFYGHGMAICAGNITQALAYDALTHASSTEAIQTKLLEKLSAEISRVNGGQMQDFHFGASSEEPTPEQILQMYCYKAARYTFSLPLVLGALTANADTSVIHTLDKLGENLGLVFQIKDDEIELYSSEDEIGKPVGSDIRENKKTYIRALLFSQVNESEKNKLKGIFGNKNLIQDDIDYVKQLVHQYSIDKEIHKLMQELSEEAKVKLGKINGDNEYKKILEDLMRHNTTRTS